jgi:hypothetical protein
MYLFGLLLPFFVCFAKYSAMEKITDFFKEIKERLSNPFISSFLISWMVVNWNLVVALMFYNREDFKLIGKKGFIDYAQGFTDDSDLFWTPLTIALGYTFVFPFLRNIILASQAWFKRWGSQWNRRVSKGNLIDIRKYMELRDEYKTRNEQLIKLVEEESETTNKNAKLQTEIIELNGQIAMLNTTFGNTENELKLKSQEIGKLEQELKATEDDHQQRLAELVLQRKEAERELQLQTNASNLFKKAGDPGLINGEYHISPTIFAYDREKVLFYRIQDRVIIEVTDMIAREIEQIVFFHYSNSIDKLQFVTKDSRDPNQFHYYDLDVTAKEGVYNGMRNGETIEFSRIIQIPVS